MLQLSEAIVSILRREGADKTMILGARLGALVHKEEAAAAVPDEFLDETALIGPIERIRERYKLWADDPITGITVNTDQPEAMEFMAELAELEPARV